MAKAAHSHHPPEPTTSEKLQKLLDLLNVQVVYYVDDAHNLADFDVQIIAGELVKIFGLSREADLLAIDLPKWNRSLPQDETIDSLRILWTDITIEKKMEIYNAILQISNTTEENPLDFRRAGMVSAQFPDSMVKSLSPQQWEQEFAKLPDLLKGDKSIFIIFDEDLSHAGGTYTIRRGQDLIVQLLAAGHNAKIICTLLSHKITSLNDEMAFRDRLISERPAQDLRVNDFFALTKQRLDQPEVFADGIRKALLNRHLEVVKSETVALIKYSYEEAIKKIKEYDTYDFDDTILKTSIKDGVWEPETIMRISDIVFENEMKRRMVETGYVPKVNKELKASQLSAGIKFTIPPNTLPYSEKLHLRYQEIYDEGTLINELRKPLENGDIFQLGTNQYILVAQPCDMVVRKKGDEIGLRNVKVATLLKIEVITADDYKQKIKNPVFLTNKFELRYFKKGTTDIGIVHFTEYLLVDIDHLDLCVFNKDGVCAIDLAKPENRDYLSRNWEFRYDRVINQLRRYSDKISSVKRYLRPRAQHPLIRRFAEAMPKFLRKRTSQIRSSVSNRLILEQFYPLFILASSSQTEVAVKMEADNTFNFQAKRVGKYKNYGAAYLLQEYTRHMARAAEPHDFAVTKS